MSSPRAASSSVLVAEDVRAVSRSKRLVGEKYWPWVEFGPGYAANDAKIRLANGSCMELACLGITKFYNEILAHCCRHDIVRFHVIADGMPLAPFISKDYIISNPMPYDSYRYTCCTHPPRPIRVCLWVLS